MALRVSEEEYKALIKRSSWDYSPGLKNPYTSGPKYHNKKITLGDATFDSRAEAQRWLELQALANAGKITNLQRQVEYGITVCGHRICKYVADFVYTEDGKDVVEDVKGVCTPVYRLKKKLVEAVYGIRIREVTMKKR